jgi:hypothetical protein
MATTTSKRGRPPKGQDRVKADYLDIRLGSSEKATFKDAAELAGLDLSAWVRERLRTAARKELEAADMPVAFLGRPAQRPTLISDTRPDHLTEVRSVNSSRIFLRFADGVQGTWSLPELELDPANLNMAAMKVAQGGTSIRAKTKLGEIVFLDAAWLRAAVDPEYNAELEKELVALRGPLDDLKVVAPKKSHRGR